MTLRHSFLLVGCALGMVGCGSSEPSSRLAEVGTTVAETPTSITTTPGSSGPRSTVAQQTNAPSSTSVPTSTSASTPPDDPCVRPTSTESISIGFPQALSSLSGQDIRTGAHACFERVVLELQGSGDLPGYRVEYVDDPVKLSPSDLTVEIAGDATLVLSVGAWMTTMEGEGYDGPQQIEPTNVEHISELRLIENFEGMHQWAIGLDERRAFDVTTLLDPPRIVIDIAT